MPLNHLSIRAPRFGQLDAALTEWVAHRSTVCEDEPSEAFLIRARKTARLARSLSRLAKAVTALGFQPYPLPEFLAAAARLAHLNLDRLLSPPQEFRSPIFPWVQLAKSVEVPRQWLSIITRLWVAERDLHLAGTVGLLARNDAATAVSLDDPDHPETDEVSVTQSLERLEAAYQADSRSILAICLAEVAE